MSVLSARSEFVEPISVINPDLSGALRRDKDERSELGAVERSRS